MRAWVTLAAPQYIRRRALDVENLGLQAVLVLLAGALVLVAAFRRLQLPQILAYVFVGMLLGPHGAGVFRDSETTRYLGEFGLVFLMFTIGLEVSLSRLVALRQAVFVLGSAQVLLTAAVIAGGAVWWGLDWRAALGVGAVLAMSSTAIVMKLLTEQLEQRSRHGQQALGILLFQDIAVVPLLILIPLLGTGGASSAHLLRVFIAGGVLVAGYILAGRYVLRPLLHHAALGRSREFFMLMLLFIVLASAWLTESVGLSLAAGAFLAGLMIGETEYRHQVEVDILPFRDILLGLFFVSTGIMFDPGVITSEWVAVLVVVAALVVLKAALVFGLVRLLKFDTGVALRTGLVLAQGGEFGFALLLQATTAAVLPVPTAQIVLAGIIVSMTVAPILVRFNGAIAKGVLPRYNERREANIAAIRYEARATHPDVIVCGYGRSGQNLGWMLTQEGVPFLALDLDPVRVRDARDAGDPVVYGDATRRDVLLAAGLEHARALAISYDDVASALRILNVVRMQRPDLPIIVRTRDDGDLERLTNEGATEVVPESLEGSLMMASHVLMLLGIPVGHIVRRVRDVQRDRYRMLRGFFPGTDAPEPTARNDRLYSVMLAPRAAAVGRSLADLKFDEIGVRVTAIRRAGIRGPEPSLDTVLEAGDVLVLHGAAEALRVAERRLLRG